MQSQGRVRQESLVVPKAIWFTGLYAHKISEKLKQEAIKKLDVCAVTSAGKAVVSLLGI